VMRNVQSKLSMLWIFYVLNIAYGDIGTLYYSVFINPTPLVHYTQVFLLGAAVLVEIPMVMILLSRMLNYRPNRFANIVVGVVLTGVELASLFVGTPTLAYAFIGVISVATSAYIVFYAWKWHPVSPAIG
jgi:hypothetical protein